MGSPTDLLGGHGDRLSENKLAVWHVEIVLKSWCRSILSLGYESMLELWRPGFFAERTGWEVVEVKGPPQAEGNPLLPQLSRWYTD
jgi:hypothetical protein